jgi:hypothetical protein
MNYILKLSPTNTGLQLFVMCADVGSDLNPDQIAAIRDAIAEKVDGRFDFVLYREAESDFMSDSD